MRRSTGRRRPIPRWRSDARYYGWGEQVTDGISGVSHPRSLMVRQCGTWRRRDWGYGTRDWCDRPGECCLQGPGQATVSVVAVDAAADEDGGTGSFTITRAGHADQEQRVHFALTGTAMGGSDYTVTAGGATGPTATSVLFAANQTVATVTITPSADALDTEGDETVILTLVAAPTLGYYVPVDGTQTATVTITEVLVN